MSRQTRRLSVVAGGAAALFTAAALTVPGAALADDQGCATAAAKGGPASCSSGGAAPIGEREGACYEDALKGILGGPLGMAVGCAGGVLFP